ncbi:MAG: TonB-dependent receptor [Sphingobium sp.]
MTIAHALSSGPGLMALALSLTIHGAARAQDATAPADDTRSILVTGHPEENILVRPNGTGSRLNLSPLETPASIAILDGDVIRSRGDRSIVDAISRAPGITSIANLGNGNTALAARGFKDQGSVLQLVDGVRLFPAAGTITFPTDPWMVERIDVLSGPASVLYGQGALGGAINVIPRKPNSDRTVVEGEIGYGSQDSFHAAVGVGGPIDDQWSYRVDGSYRRSDGYVDRGQSRSLALSATLRWQPIDQLTVTLRDDYGDQQPSKYFGTPLIDGKLDTRIRDRNYNVADAYIRFRDNRTTLQIDWQPTDAITVSNQVYRLTSVRRWQDLESYCWVGSTGNCPNGYNSSAATPGTIYRTDNTGIVHDQLQWGDQGSVTLHSPLGGGISNDLVVGFDVNSVRLTYSHNFDDVVEDEVDPFRFDPGRFLNTVGIVPRYYTRTNEYALFAEDRLKLGETLSLVAGVRYESDHVRRWNVGNGTPVVDKRLKDTTWRVGGVYRPTRSISLYAQYSTGVDPLGTLTTYSSGQVQFSHATGDQVEVGAKAQFLDGRGSATLAAYRIVKQGLLSQRTLASAIEQVGQRSAKGIEASMSLDLPWGFGVDANGTILEARFDDFRSGGIDYAGRTPPNIPEQAANLWLRWDATGRLQGRLGLRYVGATYSDNANSFRIPGYATIDGGISFAVTPQIALDVHGYNLLDKDYVLTSYNDEQWILARPRSVDISLRAAF